MLVRRDETPSPTQLQSEFLQTVQVGGVDYILLTTALEDTYSLTLTDGTRCFKGDTSATSQHVQVSSLTRSALTTGSTARFEYSVEAVGDEAVRFCWKQVLDDQRGGPRRKLGTVELRRVQQDGAAMEVLAGAARVVRDAEARLASVTDQLERLRRDHDRALDQLEQSARTKESLENELYSKFALVLNSKKRRIAELLGEQTAESVDEPMAGSEDEPVAQQAASKRKGKRVAKPVGKKSTAKRAARQKSSKTREDESESLDEPMTGSEDDSVAEPAVQQATSRQEKSVAKSGEKRTAKRCIEKSVAEPVVELATRSGRGLQTTSSEAESVVQQATRPVAKRTTETRTIEKSVAEPVVETTRSRQALPSSSVYDLIEGLL